MTKDSNKIYIPALDGFRGLAVLLVILVHWEFPLLHIPFGWIGVNFFFVLSGFLISNNLLANKLDYNLSEYLRLFYLKRVLRICPIYFLYIIVTSLILFIAHTISSIGLLEESFNFLKLYLPFILTYTFNLQHFLEIFIYNSGLSGSEFFDHLWSLSIEEQFYLVFPFLVFFLSKKRLKVLMIVIIITLPALRVLAGEFLKSINPNFLQNALLIYKSSFLQLDSFAFGILLAVINKEKIQFNLKWLWIAIINIIGLFMIITHLTIGEDIFSSFKSLGLYFLSFHMEYGTNTLLDYLYGFLFTFINLIGFLFITACLYDNKLTSFLKNKFLLKLGKISYGVYLYHYAIYSLTSTAAIWLFGKSLIQKNILLEISIFSIYFLIVYVTANLSYKFIEIPFLHKKEKLNKSTEKSRAV